MSTFDDNLRNALQAHVQETDETFFKVSENTGISHQIIYHFRDGDGGLNGENTVKLMNYLNLTFEELK